MITARGLTKHYGRTVAVRDLTFAVRPGVVTGFLGPNGAGKSTTMRMLIGLDRPDAGQASVNGKPFRELRRPLREVGAMLEAGSFHPGRSARAHLGALAVSNAIPLRRVEEVLALVGLEAAARRRAGKLSLGMAQRLGIAAALTSREREVLALMAEGRSNSGIAGKLVLSESAVEKHVASIFGKLSLELEAADNRRVLAVLRYLSA
jgi:ABC-type multidrug transport system ATPase subunit